MHDHCDLHELMTHDTIHLIWLGDSTQMSDAVQHWQQFGGGRKVELHTDDSRLLPQWREVWKLATTPLLQSDLLRWSILLTQGGWYFDCDVRTRLPLDTVEKECKIAAKQCFVTFFSPAVAFPKCDVLACTPAWPGKQQMIDFVASTVAVSDPLVFASSMLHPILDRHREWFCWGDPNRYAYMTADWTQRVFSPNGDFGPFLNTLSIRRVDADSQKHEMNEEETAAITEGMSRLRLSAQVAGRYAAALLKWSRAGWPLRRKADVKRIFRQQCLPCPEHRRGKCKKCGCRISEGTLALVIGSRSTSVPPPRSPSGNSRGTACAWWQALSTSRLPMPCGANLR
jgi:hypothetical protein